MLPIQKWRRRTRNEKLTAIRIGSAVRHAQQTRLRVLEGEVLVAEGRAVVDRGTAGAVAIQEVAALDHEGRDHAVEFRGFVALRFAQWGFVLASAELAEVFGGSGHGAAEELHFDAAEGFAWGVVSMLAEGGGMGCILEEGKSSISLQGWESSK